MSDLSKSNLQNEFQIFLNSDKQIPDNLAANVVIKISKLLNPNAGAVFIKILLFHFVVGFVSLSVCHQFEINPFNTEVSLANWFMNLGGHNLCMFGCGIIYLASSIIVAGLFLTKEEVKALKRTSFVQVVFLAGISLIAFALCGAHLAFTFVGVWLLGAVLGGIVAIKALDIVGDKGLVWG